MIVGAGPGLSYLRQRAAARGVTDKIIFQGFVPEEDMSGVWSEANVFAMPSRGEGFGLTYIEAMRHGLPVVASVHDAAPEINLDDETGYNVDLNKLDELPERLTYLLKNRDVAADLGGNAQRRWVEYFRYSAFRERVVPLLREFLVT